MLNSEYDWQFRTESNTACLAYPKGCLRPRGKMLGGTSSINSMLLVFILKKFSGCSSDSYYSLLGTFVVIDTILKNGVNLEI